MLLLKRYRMRLSTYIQILQLHSLTERLYFGKRKVTVSKLENDSRFFFFNFRFFYSLNKFLISPFWWRIKDLTPVEDLAELSLVELIYDSFDRLIKQQSGNIVGICQR